MRKLFTPLLILTTLMFAFAPVVIANALFESTMGLVQKIFYFHVPSWFAMFTAVFVCGIASAVYLFKGRQAADRIAGITVALAGASLLLVAEAEAGNVDLGDRDRDDVLPLAADELALGDVLPEILPDPAANDVPEAGVVLVDLERHRLRQA